MIYATVGPRLDYVNARVFGAKGDGITDDTAALQGAINSLPAGTDTLYLPAGIYKVTSTITVSQPRVHVVGDGVYSTKILFAPSGNSVCFAFNASGSVLFQCSLRDLALYSNDATFTKTGVQLTDCSGFVMENVAIGGSVVAGNTSYWSGGSSVGLQLRGREAGLIRGVTIAADKPIQISVNPNSTISIDHHHFCDLNLTANANPVITIDTGVNVSNVTFDGFQAWVKGTHGLYWKDTTTSQISFALSIANVRYEQGESSSSYFIRIEHNYHLYQLTIKNCYGGVDRNGLYLRNCNNVLFEQMTYTGTAGVALDADSTVVLIRGALCFWQAGSTATLVGQRNIWSVPKNPSSGALPPDFYYDSAANTNQNISTSGAISSDALTIADSATAALGQFWTGLLTVTDSRGIAGMFQLCGNNNVARKVIDPATNYSVTAGNAGTVNVYWDGVSSYVIENKTGSSIRVKWTLAGSNIVF